MAVSYARDPYDPTLTDTHAYGHNAEGALQFGIGVSLVELLVLIAVLRPWKPGPAWGRLLVALGLLLPWALFSAVLTMHSGDVILIHFLWLGVLVVALGVALFVSVVRAAVGSKSPPQSERGP
jgi:hypothetical protein